MIRDARLLREFEDDQIRRRRGTYLSNLEIFEALWEHGRLLGVLPSPDPLAGIEVDTRLARALRVR